MNASMRNHQLFGIAEVRRMWANTRYNISAARGAEECDPAYYVADIMRDNFVAYASFRACANAGDKAMVRRWQKVYRYTDEAIAVVRDGLSIAFPTGEA